MTFAFGAAPAYSPRYDSLDSYSNLGLAAKIGIFCGAFSANSPVIFPAAGICFTLNMIENISQLDPTITVGKVTKFVLAYLFSMAASITFFSYLGSIVPLTPLLIGTALGILAYLIERRIREIDIHAQFRNATR